MAAYRRVYGSHHLQADCQEPGSAPEPYARQSSMDYLYLFIGSCGCSKQSQRAIDELQRTVVDVESKYKAELGRLRKKYEQQLGEYETQLDTLTRSNGELARANKALAARIKVWALRNELGTKACRYNWHSAGSLACPFPVLEYKCICQIKYTEATSSNSTRKLLWFESTKMPIAV